MTDEELAAAWSELHEATPAGWFVGRPAYNERRDEWSLYAFDTTERLKVGRRERKWKSVAPTHARVVREMARCLRELTAGRIPS
jgi:hypothetical protein